MDKINELNERLIIKLEEKIELLENSLSSAKAIIKLNENQIEELKELTK